MCVHAHVCMHMCLCLCVYACVHTLVVGWGGVCTGGIACCCVCCAPGTVHKAGRGGGSRTQRDEGGGVRLAVPTGQLRDLRRPQRPPRPQPGGEPAALPARGSPAAPRGTCVAQAGRDGPSTINSVKMKGGDGLCWKKATPSSQRTISILL